jgi:hypothetical protein
MITGGDLKFFEDSASIQEATYFRLKYVGGALNAEGGTFSRRVMGVDECVRFARGRSPRSRADRGPVKQLRCRGDLRLLDRLSSGGVRPRGGVCAVQVP